MRITLAGDQATLSPPPPVALSTSNLNQVYGYYDQISPGPDGVLTVGRPFGLAVLLRYDNRVLVDAIAYEEGSASGRRLELPAIDGIPEQIPPVEETLVYVDLAIKRIALPRINHLWAGRVNRGGYQDERVIGELLLQPDPVRSEVGQCLMAYLYRSPVMDEHERLSDGFLQLEEWGFRAPTPRFLGPAGEADLLEFPEPLTRDRLAGLTLWLNRREDRLPRFTGSHPEGFQFYPFHPEEVTGVVRDIDHIITRQGRVLPYAYIDCGESAKPRFLSVDLFSVNQALQKGWRTGEVVTLKNEGKHKYVKIGAYLTLGSEAYKPPQRCPCCQKQLRWTGEHLLCTNPRCREKIRAYLTYALSPPAFPAKAAIPAIDVLVSSGVVWELNGFYQALQHPVVELSEDVREKAKAAMEAVFAPSDDKKHERLIQFGHALGLDLLTPAVIKKVARACQDAERPFDTFVAIISSAERLVHNGANKAAAPKIASYVRERRLLEFTALASLFNKPGGYHPDDDIPFDPPYVTRKG